MRSAIVPSVAVLVLATAAGLRALAAPAASDGAFGVRPVAATPHDRRAVADGTTAFACDVYARLRDRPGNLVFSPVSLSVALAMAAEGAAGRTRAEIASVLRVRLPRDRASRAFQSVLAQMTPLDSEGVQFDVANGLWSDRLRPLRTSFVERLRERFGAAAASVDFELPADAAAEINGWADEATHGAVPRVLEVDDLPARTFGSFVLANAVRFVGAWESPFDGRQDGVFHAPGGDVAVPLMSVTAGLPAARFDGFDVVELPYEGGDYAMTVIVPAPGAALSGVESDLTARNLATWTAALAPDSIDLHFPPFAFASKEDLSAPLADLGMTTAFSRKADFSRATGSRRGVHVGPVLQNASVAVDEQGAVAAAVTTVVFIGVGTAIGDTPRVVRVDRPFVFVIRHRPTGTLLFMGRVENPTAP